MKARAMELTENRYLSAGRVITLARVVSALALSLLILAAARTARADGLSDIPGAFVDVGTGADAAGMGGAVVASIDGATALFWNPAGLVGAEHRQEYLLTHGSQMGLVPYSAGAGLFRLGDYTIGAGLLYSGDDVLSETTLLVGAARELPAAPFVADGGIHAGVTVRTRWASFGNNESQGEQVSGSAFGLGLDAGVVVPLTERLALGLAGRDIVNVVNWDSSSGGKYEENVPAVVVAGLALSPTEGFLFELDLDKALRADLNDVVRAGAEVTLLDVAVVRGGYTTALPDGEPEEYSVGAGARVPAGSTTVGVDLAYLFGRLENTLRLSLSIDLP